MYVGKRVLRPAPQGSRSRTRTCPTASGKLPCANGAYSAGTLSRCQPSALQRLPVEVARARVVAPERLARDVLVGVAEARLGESHARCQPAEHFGVGQRFAQRRDRRVVGQRVQVAVRAVDVDLLELRRGGQQDVGEVGGIGLEDLVHDAEQVLAREARAHLARLRRDRDRIASCRRRSRGPADRARRAAHRRSPTC